jgi:Na+-translocating ferredoxin:NAD+ oxidoreductase RnfE subunit
MAIGSGMRVIVADAARICLRREHLRRTVRIALVVGVILTTINQADVIIRGDATAVTWIKAAGNFAVPFIVSNLGLLARRSPERDADAPDQPATTA